MDSTWFYILIPLVPLLSQVVLSASRRPWRPSTCNWKPRSWTFGPARAKSTTAPFARPFGAGLVIVNGFNFKTDHLGYNEMTLWFFWSSRSYLKNLSANERCGRGSSASMPRCRSGWWNSSPVWRPTWRRRTWRPCEPPEAEKGAPVLTWHWSDIQFYCWQSHEFMNVPFFLIHKYHDSRAKSIIISKSTLILDTIWLQFGCLEIGLKHVLTTKL